MSPQGKRLYAVGDVHGCLDELKKLIYLIEEDNKKRSQKSTTIVLLGDLIDRGPDSAGVIDYWMNYSNKNVQSLHLIGNHEEMMINVLEGDVHLLEDWLKYGGNSCLKSYGMSPETLLNRDPDSALITLKKRIPLSHINFLKNGYDRLDFGDYILVHAGVDPRQPIDDQTAEQFHWIREPFLSWSKPVDIRVVHGHTITQDVELKDHRIGVDTGAYLSGKLSCVRLEDDIVDVLCT